MVGLVEKERAAAALEGEMAEICGVLKGATGRLVGLIAQVLATRCREGWASARPSPPEGLPY